MIQNKVIFITGAGKGIGEACVQQIIKKKDRFQNTRLFLTSRTESDLKSLSELAKANQIECKYYRSDLAEAPLAAFQACMKVYGRIDIFIHSAGIGRFGNFLELTMEDLKVVMKTNVEASFLLTQAVYAQMKKISATPEEIRGQIQWVTSVAAEKPFEQSAIYCMSKFAQRGLIEVMRLSAYSDRIRILEVKPGATLTPMWGKVEQDQAAKMMRAEDIAIPMIEALFLHPRATLEAISLRPLAGDI